MLPAKKRLSVPLFTNALANGKIVHSTLFTARIFKTATPKDAESRFSAVIGKKIGSTAVVRNKFRRKIYAAVSVLAAKIKPGFHVILLGKSPLMKALQKDIMADLESLFVKSSLIK